MLTKEQTSFMQQRNSRFTGPESDSSSSEDEEDTRREGGHEFHTHMVTREGLLDFELMAADIEAVLRKVRMHVHSTKHHNALSIRRGHPHSDCDHTPRTSLVSFL
jgi:hypothetical protein